MAVSVPGNSCGTCISPNTGCVLTTDKICYTGPILGKSGININDTVTTAIVKLNNTISTLYTVSNGISLDGSSNTDIEWGQPVGAVGNPAVLTVNREIPLGGKNVFFSGTGNLVIGANSTTDTTSRLQVNGPVAIYAAGAGTQQILKLNSAQTLATPFYEVFDSNGNLIYAVNTLTNGNLFLGANVGINNTTGNENVAIGVTGFGNVGCFTANTTGSQCVAIGGRALPVNTTGNQNIAVGDATLFSNTTGSRNLAFGQATLAFTTTNNDNIAFGVNAGHKSTANYDRCFLVGTSAYSNAVGGSDAIIIGNTAVGNVSATHGTGNIVLGNSACANSTLGNYNIIMGYFAHSSSTTLGDNNISLGNNSSFGASVANTTLIGYAMSTSASNICAIGRADQNVIIGQTTGITDGGAKLQIAGDVSTADPGAGIGKWKLGTVVTASSTLDTTRYVQISIGGVVVKLAVIQ